MIALAFLSLLFSWTAEYPLLHEMTPAGVDSLLADERWIALDIEEKLEALTLLRIHTPYELGCLGEENDSDPDPLFRLDRADCTVFVVTNAALLHARSFADAESLIHDVHYRDGTVSYKERYHFTTDRITTGQYFKEITTTVAPDSMLETITLTLNRKSDGSRLLPIDWERKLTVRFLPVTHLNEQILQQLPRAYGVAFLKRKNMKNSFLVSHEGILIADDRLHHASSRAGRVIESPLFEYLEGSSFDGMLFFGIR